VRVASSTTRSSPTECLRQSVSFDIRRNPPFPSAPHGPAGHSDRIDSRESLSCLGASAGRRRRALELSSAMWHRRVTSSLGQAEAERRAACGDSS
jgi:hypothetical protein